MKKIESLFTSLKIELSELLESELYFPINITHSLGHKKELFKSKMEKRLDRFKLHTSNIFESEKLLYNAKLSASESVIKSLQENLQTALINYSLRIEKYKIEDNKYQINNTKVIVENNFITLINTIDNSSIVLTPQEFELIKLIRSNKE